MHCILGPAVNILLCELLGVVPTSDDEYNLLYVAVTRAKLSLLMTNTLVSLLNRAGVCVLGLYHQVSKLITRMSVFCKSFIARGLLLNL